MKIIISPAKKMNIDDNTFGTTGMPVFIDEANRLKNHIQQMSLTEMQALWKCNNKLAQQNFDRFKNMNLKNVHTPAILAYEGLQYQYMYPRIFTEKAQKYLEEHLRILSGFYGLLRPFDAVTPYRLEMQTKLAMGEYRDLYAFWSDRIYQKLLEKDQDRIIINLASKEYGQVIEKYLSQQDRFITIEFCESVDGKLVQKGTLAKMARGSMVRFMAEQNATNPEQIKKFCEMGFQFHEELSDNNKYIFIK